MYRLDKVNDIMRTVSEIDKDHNGYVTCTELDDILKLFYPHQLEDRDLTPIIQKFSSVQNKILIDYKKFRDWIKLEIKKKKAIKLLKAEKLRSNKIDRDQDNFDRMSIENEDMVSRLDGDEVDSKNEARYAYSETRRLARKNLKKLGAISDYKNEDEQS